MSLLSIQVVQHTVQMYCRYAEREVKRFEWRTFLSDQGTSLSVLLASRQLYNVYNNTWLAIA